MSDIDIRQSALEMLVDTLADEAGAGSDLDVFLLEEGGEWAEIRGFIDMGHLVSEVVSWAREQYTREPSDAEVLAALNAREISVRERNGSARHFNPAPDLSYYSEGNIADTRAALLAAQEVRRD